MLYGTLKFRTQFFKQKEFRYLDDELLEWKIFRHPFLEKITESVLESRGSCG